MDNHALLICLIEDGLINNAKLNDIVNDLQLEEMTITQYLVKKNMLASNLLLAYCEKKFALPVYSFTEQTSLEIAISIISADLIYKYRIVPLLIEQQLYLGVTDPTNYAAINTISFHAGISSKLILIAEADLERIISTHIKPAMLTAQADNASLRVFPNEIESTTDEANELEPVIEFVNRIIHDAIQNHISDIHIEPCADYCRIRFRRDGLLYEAATMPDHLATRIMTRLKIMAQLNIAERRLPQDGRIQIRTPYKLDIRMNTCPTLYGEKIVLRLLQTTQQLIQINSLGMTIEQRDLLILHLNKTQGLILVTGPTGSGKTISLYSALDYLNKIDKNICTVEDPIEIELPGINQVNVNTKIDLGFATVLRTFLRQDPDIIMVGEIRDKETATIAMQAAQTGHLVLSTLHTNSAIDTIMRLRLLGANELYFTNSISLLIAQRLLRKLCEKCKTIAATNKSSNYKANGCEYCLRGYKGRIAIFELVPMTEELSDMILSNASKTCLLDYIKTQNWPTLLQAGLQLVESGTTDLPELLRVISYE